MTHATSGLQLLNKLDAEAQTLEARGAPLSFGEAQRRHNRDVMRIVLALVLTLAAVPMAARQWLTSLDAAHAAARKSDRLIFVDLYATWCGPCHLFEQTMVPSAGFARATEGMVLLRLDFNQNQGLDFAKRFGITTLPTFVLLTADDVMAGIVRGYTPASFTKQIGDAREQYRAFHASVEREPSFARDFQRRLALALEFRSRFAYAACERRLRALVGEKDVPPAVESEAYFELARTLMLEGRMGAAAAPLDRLESLQRSGIWVERSLLLRAQLYQREGKLQDAIDLLRTFESRYPRSTLRPEEAQMLARLEKAARGR